MLYYSCMLGYSGYYHTEFLSEDKYIYEQPLQLNTDTGDTVNNKSVSQLSSP